MTTDRAGLGGVGRWNFNQSFACPGELVAELLYQLSPTRSKNSSIESGLLPDILAGLLQSAFGTLGHIADLELLNNDHTVALSVFRAEIVQEMFSLPSHLPVQNSDAVLGLLPIFGSFLLSADVSLSTYDPLGGCFKMPRIRGEMPLTVSNDIDHSSIERDDRCRAGRGIGDLGLVDQARKPLPSLFAQRARLRFTNRLSMHNGAQIAELGEAQNRAVEAPHSRVRFVHTKSALIFRLEMRCSSKTGEAAGPCLVEFD